MGPGVWRTGGATPHSTPSSHRLTLPTTWCPHSQKCRDQKGLCFVDIRDRFGITQVVFDQSCDKSYAAAKELGREFVIQVTGKVMEREMKNNKRETGDVEIKNPTVTVLGHSKTPPFKIEDECDAGEQSRMQYRYLDLRRGPVQAALMLRNQVTIAVRKALNSLQFCEVETPILIKSTPEGARDFVVPSRENPGKFYALPQSPQTFKQLIMVGGMDRYFQIARCFRDEGTVITQNRQPEFTQIDCEMSFVTQKDILATFENMMRNLVRDVTGFELPTFPQIRFDDCMRDYGIDKPDLRYDMKLADLTQLAQPCPQFPKFDTAEMVVAVVLESLYTDMNKKELDKKLDRKNLESVDELFKLAEKKGIGAGIFWVKVLDLANKKFESPLSKNFSDDQFAAWAKKAGAKDNTVMVVLAGPNQHEETRMCMGKLRHSFGSELGLRSTGFSALWVVDFPLLEWDEDEGRCIAMHHPFTSPAKGESTDLFMTVDPAGDPAPLEKIRANAYDMVLNGIEAGGGSIRITDPATQARMFELLNMSPEEYEGRFGFLMEAFRHGAPPHGGLAFGLDRLCTIIGEAMQIPQQLDKPTISIRDYMAFPKTKGGQDAMIRAPCGLPKDQLAELYVQTTVEPEPEEDPNASKDEVCNVDEARMTEIKAKLDALEAQEPPNPRGKPTPEWLEQSKAHAANRGAYEATLTEDEIKACQARGWYVKGPKGAKGDKKKDKKEKKKGGEQPKQAAAPKQEEKPKKKEEKPAGKKEKSKKEAKPADPAAEAKLRAKKVKAIEKEGGKKGVEIEGASDMGGLAFFCTTLMEPDGDMADLEMAFAAMNAKPPEDPEEERRGGAGHVGKMVFSAGVDNLQIVCNMPEDLQVDKAMEDGPTRKAMFADKWVQHVLDNFAKECPGLKASGDKNFAKGTIPANKDLGFFPLKFKDDAMSFAYGLLRQNNCFKDDASSEGKVYGDFEDCDY